MEVYDEYKGESNVIIRARLLERILIRKDIFLDGNPVVGTMTGVRAGVYPYPEWQVNWIKDGLDMVKMSSLGEVSIPAETRELLKKIYKQVYDTGKLTMERLLEALAANFEGSEEERKLCFEAPKHGNDDADVDAFVQRMYRDIELMYRASGTDYFDYETRMDAFSLSFHNYFTPMTGALPNGRRRGEPLTDASVSAMPGTDVNSITAMLRPWTP